MISNIVTLWNYLKIYILEENITLGKSVVIGGGCVIKTTDGGKIIIEDGVSIEKYSYIYSQSGIIHIGKNTFIGTGSQIVSKKSIKIGENNLIAAYSILRDANHNTRKNSLINVQGHIIKSIILADDVWLGVHSVVTAGNIVGKGAVVGANAVVTKDVNDYTIVGGVPAKFIKYRI